MPPKSKSIFRQPGAKHFQLVHRSQRDPLIHDPESSQHVLKAFDRGNARKGKSRAELESEIPIEDLEHDFQRSNLGEAAAYGVYFDDTEYDYMQHLRQVGIQEAGVDSVLIEATPSKPKGKAKEAISLVDIPKEALPSSIEVPRNFETQESIPSSIAGFQPDMDPHLRQVLEALEDDAFVEDDLDEDFFGELVAEGERAPHEEFEYEFHEDGLPEDVEDGDGSNMAGDPEVPGEQDESWEARFNAFKTAQNRRGPPSDDGTDLHSESADTVGTLPQLPVIGGKRRRKGTSDASGYSMSSSSMFRNEGLTTLDERFDQIQREYDSDEDEEEEGNDAGSDTDSAPELITSREDFDDMMNEFLENYEVLGGKMLHVLPGQTPIGKLDVFRKALGEAKIRDGADEESDNDDDILMPLDVDDKADRWDCETILTTYSNLENHPRLIRARTEKPVPKIRLDPKTGLPIVQSAPEGRRSVTPTQDDPRPVRTTVTRPKNESKEEKKLRKQAVKAERQERRVEKKATKEQFSNAIKQEVKVVAAKEKTTKLRKL
ncbi:Low temperature viability protein-domain-containing protein [Cristinia sonorae]|uniref:Low temperature viability protein-domain-containing protein n=1 Tax=Cristinia sonorae TaxID=1940300 RepID=A0A8K0UJ31_9AGAR|nr:Low temperature viability protein-domain-containing protein [Cristinia sonorae]